MVHQKKNQAPYGAKFFKYCGFNTSTAINRPKIAEFSPLRPFLRHSIIAVKDIPAVVLEEFG